ncbi:MAG TPA: class I SAM-dependent methyltransferase [Acidimicrobiales bacterium]|nr:class I SAM-dependent methyltransferase [Acidimicrobiales bacterium]
MRKPSDGAEFYDEEGVFERYFAPRTRASDSPVLTMEMPAFWDAAGDVTDLAILDLGCGDGQLGEELVGRGAARYVGIDASERMVTAAASRLGEEGRAAIVRADLATYQPREQFDLVVSLRVLHYVADLTGVLHRAAAALHRGGRVVYSHEHPIVTSFEAREPDGRRANWTVDNYFASGPREVIFLGKRVVKHHRTVEEHLRAVADAGLSFSRLSECAPVRERFEGDEAEYERRLRIPLFLMIEASRSN